MVTSLYHSAEIICPFFSFSATDLKEEKTSKLLKGTPLLWHKCIVFDNPNNKSKKFRSVVCKHFGPTLVFPLGIVPLPQTGRCQIYLGSILYSRVSVLRFSASSCQVLSATISSRLLAYFSSFSTMWSMMLCDLECEVRNWSQDEVSKNERLQNESVANPGTG